MESGRDTLDSDSSVSTATMQIDSLASKRGGASASNATHPLLD